MPRKGYKTLTVTEEAYVQIKQDYDKNRKYYSLKAGGIVPFTFNSFSNARKQVLKPRLTPSLR